MTPDTGYATGKRLRGRSARRLYGTRQCLAFSQLHPFATMYIDPGAGSLLFQVIAAGAVGLLASIGRLRRAIADFFAKLRRR